MVNDSGGLAFLEVLIRENIVSEKCRDDYIKELFSASEIVEFIDKEEKQGE